jgi:defect-in-organelle-trafficking protein DotD
MSPLRLSALFAALVVSGCSTPPAKNPAAADAERSARRQDLDARLSDTEARVAALKRSTSTAANRPVGGVRVNPDNKVTVSWSGEAAPLVTQLARAKGLEPKITGKPIMPIPVSIDVTDADVVDVLRDIGAQLGSRADLIMRNNQLELRYRTF